jgi:arylsulfatase A-like enzyme
MASPYYANDDETLRTWEGYDVFAQTRDAAEYMTQHARVQAEKPFALFLSYGPPHNPYHTAPEEYRAHYPPDELVLPPNVHPDCAASARRDLAGYYAHIHAMDDAIGRIIASLSQLSLLDNTLVVLTSDHGDSVWSHCLPQTGNINKQRPYDESILTPFLMRCPASMPIPPRVVADPFATPDVMPTLLDLLNLPIPDTVEGVSLADTVRETITGAGADSVSSFSRKREGVLIAAYAPFADWSKDQGGVPYRGIRTERYTYVKTREKFWMLFDNRDDPYQRCNRIDDPGMKSLREHLDRQLDLILAEQGDDFPDAEILYARYGYHGVNAKGIIPFAKGEEWYIRAAELAEAYRRG